MTAHGLRGAGEFLFIIGAEGVARGKEGLIGIRYPGCMGRGGAQHCERKRRGADCRQCAVHSTPKQRR